MIQKRKFLAVLVTLVMVVSQFAALQLTAFAEDNASLMKVVFQVPDDVTMDITNGAGKTEAEYNGLVVTMKNTLVTSSGASPATMTSMANYNANGSADGAPYWWNQATKTLEYLFSTPGTYTLYSRGPGYSRVAQMFIVTPDEIAAGAVKNIDLANGPSGYQGYQPGQWETFAQRKAADYTGGNFIPATVVVDDVLKTVAVNIDSRDQVIVVFPDELRKVFDVTPESEAIQKAASGNTDANVFPFPTDTWSSVNLDSYAAGKIGMHDIAPMELLEEWIEEKLAAFDDRARDDKYGVYENDGVYVYYTSFATSPVYNLNMPFLVFTKEDISGCETLDQVAAITVASKTDPGKPTTWHQGSIHANEPAATEGVTAVLNELLGDYGQDILDKINVLLVPRYSVDSARFYSRANYLGADPNREHLNADSREQVIWHQTFQKFMPEFAQDGHEFDHAGTSNSPTTSPGGSTTYGYMTQYDSDDLMVSEAGQLNVPVEANELSKAMADYVQGNALAAGLRVIHYGPAVSPGVGRAYYYLLGSITTISETRGIGAGGVHNYMPRRAYSQYVVIKSIQKYAAENFDEYMPAITSTREYLANTAKTYDPTDMISLDYMRNSTQYTIDTTPRLLPRYRYNLDGTLTIAPILTNNSGTLGALGGYFRSTRERTRPTAYVMSLDAPNLDGIRKVLDAQCIKYYIVAPGTEIEKLSQYYWVSGATSSARADLRSEGSVTFDKGAFIVPMDQINSTVIAMTFEPDVNDTYRTTLVNQNLLARDAANNYPLYRYQGDNPSEIAPAVEYDLVLSTDAHLIRNGDFVEVDTYFNEEVESNSLVVTYTYDGAVFELESFEPADGVTVFNKESGTGYVTLMLGLADSYEMKDLGKLTLKTIDSFTGYQDIQAWAQLAVKNELGEKELVGAFGITSVVCYEAPEFYTVVDLSNMIDWIGITNKNPEWKGKYVFYDFDNNGIIEIYDVAFLAKLVKAI